MASQFRLELDRNLTQKVLAEAVAPKMDKIGTKWEALARKYSPVDTGLMAEKVYHETDPVTGEVHCGSSVDYLVPVHEGHKVRGGARQAGKPFLYITMFLAVRNASK